MKEYREARYGTPYVKTTVKIMGRRQIDTWRAMMALSGRRAHDLAADLILDEIRTAQQDPEITELAQSIARHHRHLHVVADSEAQ